MKTAWKDYSVKHLFVHGIYEDVGIKVYFLSNQTDIA